MRVTNQLLHTIVAAGMTVAIVGAGTASAAVPGDLQADAAAVFAQTLPQAVVTTDATTIVATVPAAQFTQPGADDPVFAATPPEQAELYAAAEIGWRAQLAAAFVSAGHPELEQSTVVVPGTTLDLAAANYLAVRLGGPLRYTAAFPAVGTISRQLALEQLQSNLAVVTGLFGSDVIEGTRAEVVPVEPASNTFALRADVRVRSMRDIAPRLGDIVQGLPVGLIGDAAKNVVEGLAIDVVADSGRRAAWHMTPRIGAGNALGDTELGPTNGSSVSVTFPNLTGGPGPIASAHSGPATGVTHDPPVAALKPELRLAHSVARLTVDRATRRARIRFAAPAEALTVRVTLRRGGRTLAAPAVVMLTAGKARSVSLRLTRAAVRELRHRSRAATLTITAVDQAQGSTSFTRAAKLRLR